MNYQILFQAENESVKERYDLSMERIFTVITEDSVPEPYRAYFQKTAKFITMIGTLYEELAAGRLDQASMEVLQDWNHKLYEDILPEAYETSYANPAYAVRMLGADYGALLSFLYAELRGQIVFAYESRLTDLTILNEVFIEIYNLFEEELPKVQTIQEILYWFVSDYSDLTVTYRVREGLDPTLSFAVDLITNSDLSDLRYLYRFGEYIGESERKTADFLNHLPEETIAKMANTYTEGYRKGFEVMGRSLSGKKTVVIRCELGYER
ncbi:MAG: leucyl aminopeptidase, partial [Hungatella sp.]